jgi:hypothetical protein
VSHGLAVELGVRHPELGRRVNDAQARLPGRRTPVGEELQRRGLALRHRDNRVGPAVGEVDVGLERSHTRDLERSLLLAGGHEGEVGRLAEPGAAHRRATDGHLCRPHARNGVNETHLRLPRRGSG